MREILFRGKRVDNGEWVYGYYTKHTTGKIFIRCINKDCTQSYEVIISSVGQYTGLTDKNGNKIFEGDIIKIPDYCRRGDAIGFVYYDCSETDYCAKCWGIKYQLGADLSSDSIEIIGNIYDNLKLLEVE